MKTLFLASYFAAVENLFKRFLKQHFLLHKVLFIPNHTPSLYISGGNTFYLLQELKRKHLLPHIKKRIDEGMFYLGESAGAIITASDIEYNQIMDDKNIAIDLTNYSALNLVDFAIVPHYGEFPFEESSQKTVQIYQSKLNLLPLTNSQAVIVDEDNYTIQTNL